MILAAQKAGLQLALIDPGLAGEHTAQQRFLAHFEAEDGDGGLVVDGRILRNVDGEGGFTHRGPGGKNNQLALLKAARHAVQIGEVGGQTGDLAALLIQLVNGAEGVGDDQIERLQAARNRALRGLEQLALGLADNVERGIALVRSARDGH